MELIKTISAVLFSVGFFAIFAAWFFIFIGMHNNTKSGNSFRLLIPWIVFDKTEFTEKGNKYRVAMLWWWLVAMVYGYVFGYLSTNA